MAPAIGWQPEQMFVAIGAYGETHERSTTRVGCFAGDDCVWEVAIVEVGPGNSLLAKEAEHPYSTNTWETVVASTKVYNYAPDGS